MRIALMIEGQEGVTWADWKSLASACESGGYDALFRSDHYLGLMGEETRDVLDAWATICGLAAVTSTLRLGTLVSPVTFRHPSQLAKVVTTADHISGGRVELGMGAGWNEREHEAFGFRFPDTGERFEMLEEQVQIVHRQWTQDQTTFTGDHYSLESLQARPKPVQEPPTLLIGGEAGPRSARLAARYADEYNTLGAGPDEVAERRERLAAAWDEAGRDPETLRLSVMAGVVVGRDEDDVRERVRNVLARVGRADGDPDEFLDERRGRWIVGTPDEAIEQLRVYEQAGVTRIMLQHLVHRDVDQVRLIADEVIPAFHGG